MHGRERVGNNGATSSEKKQKAQRNDERVPFGNRQPFRPSPSLSPENASFFCRFLRVHDTIARRNKHDTDPTGKEIREPRKECFSWWWSLANEASNAPPSRAERHAGSSPETTNHCFDCLAHWLPHSRGTLFPAFNPSIHPSTHGINENEAKTIPFPSESNDARRPRTASEFQTGNRPPFALSRRCFFGEGIIPCYDDGEANPRHGGAEAKTHETNKKRFTNDRTNEHETVPTGKTTSAAIREPRKECSTACERTNATKKPRRTTRGFLSGNREPFPRLFGASVAAFGRQSLPNPSMNRINEHESTKKERIVSKDATKRKRRSSERVPNRKPPTVRPFSSLLLWKRKHFLLRIRRGPTPREAQEQRHTNRTKKQRRTK